jgi:preprotein translocase subunit SecY
MLLTAGTTFLMWLGEQINEYGIGNGMSLLIFAGIVIRLPATIVDIKLKYAEGAISIVGIILIVIGTILLISSVILLNEGERKIPVQYAKRIVGRKTIGGQSTHIPIKMNPAGVIPVIFSISLLQFPMTIAYFKPQSDFAQFITKYLSTTGTPGVYIYLVLNFILTVAFTFFYTNIVFKTDEIADNLAANGGSIPGIRPGVETKKYLGGIMHRLCWLGGLSLAAICSIPTLISAFTPINLTFGGTSIIIIVGVALDTVKQIKNRNTLNTHRGFLNR